MICLATILAVLTAQPASAQDFNAAAEKATGLIGRWRMEGDFKDVKGGLDGVAEGPATFAEGVVGQAAVFGGDSFAVVEKTPQLDVDQTTVAFFFRADAFPRRNTTRAWWASGAPLRTRGSVSIL